MIFDKFQQCFIETPITSNSLLVAKAGSGKTKCVTEKIKQHLKSGELSENTFQVLTYTNVGFNF